MAGIGDSWGTAEELLHPRDKHGRFRSKWKMAEGVAKKLLAALAAFNPRTFQSDGQSAQYLFNKAKPGRFGGGNGYHRLSADYDAANDALRAGSTDASTKKFVDMMDSSAIDLPEDIIVSRRVGPEAFGLTPETMGLDEGGLEDFTGKLIADRGYTSSNIGTPMGTAPIQVSIAVPKGTKAIIPARSRNDRQIYLDRDQEIRVTKVTPDGKGGFYVMAVATPRTPGETPTPIGGPGAPGDVSARDAEVERARQLQLQGMKVPDEPAAAHGTPRQRQEQGLAPNPVDVGPVDTGPGGPPPRNEPVHAEAIGTGGAPSPGPGAPAAGAPAAPGAAPEIPIREQDFKEATKGLPVPSAGKRRLEWNRAYMGIRGGKRDPDDILRELEKDIDVNEHTLAESKARGYDGDPEMEADVKAQKELADVIRKHSGIDGKTSGETTTPTPEPAAPEPVKAVKKAASTKRAPRKLSEADKAAETYQRRTPLDAIREAQLKEGGPKPLPAKAIPAPRPPVPEDETRRPTIGEARRLTALDAVRSKEITGEGDAAYKNIVRNLDSGEWTPAVARREARNAAKYWETRSREISANRNGRTPESTRRGEELRRISFKYQDLADELQVSQSEVRTDKLRPSSKGIPTKKPGTPAVKKAAEAEKKLPPPAKKAVPGAAPGTAAGKITTARLTPGMKILVTTSGNGLGSPTTRKTGATSITVTRVDMVSPGPGQARSRRNVVGIDANGKEVTVRSVPPAQTFIVDTPKVGSARDAELADIRDKLSGPDLTRQEQLDITSRLTQLNRGGTKRPGETTDDEILAMTKVELLAHAKQNGISVRSSMNKKQLQDEILAARSPGGAALEAPKTARQLEREANALVGRAKDPAVAREITRLRAESTITSMLDRGITPDIEHTGRRDAQARRRELTQPELVAWAGRQGVEVKPSWTKAKIREAIRAKRGGGDSVEAPPVVDNPVAQKAIQAPDRRSGFDEAWEAGNFKAPGSAGVSLDEIKSDVSTGRITPDEGIRRLESEIDFNTSEIADMDETLRGDLTPQERRDFRAQRADLLKGRNAQIRASEFMRYHFKTEPKATPDEIKMELPAESVAVIDAATPDQIRGAGKLQGLTLKGETKDELLKDLVRQLAGKELERRAAEKVAPAPKAPDKPKPNLESSPYQRIDSRALAEGLDLRTRSDQRMLDQVQAQLDGTDTSLGKNPTPAQVGRNLEKWANGPAGPAYRAAVMQSTPEEQRDARWQMERENLDIQHKEWLKLADRLKNTRRRKAEDRAPDVTPTVTRDEKKEIAHVAEVTGIPAPQLEAKALAKKKAEAPPKQSAVQVAETINSIQQSDEARELLKGRTKAELVDILKALGSNPRDGKSASKDSLIADIVGTVSIRNAVKGTHAREGEAPRVQGAVQVAETLKTVGSREEAKTLLQGRTKAELQEIAKAANVSYSSGDTKPKLIGLITQFTVGRRLDSDAIGSARMPGDSGRRRADLEDMTIPELKDLEDELGIERKSLNRGDRIQAILDAESAGTGGAASPVKSTLSTEPEVRRAQTEQAIFNAYRELVKGGSGSEFLMLADLREVLLRDHPDMSRRDVDAALVRLATGRHIMVHPEENQKLLTPREREGAITLGNQQKHKIRIESSDDMEAQIKRLRRRNEVGDETAATHLEARLTKIRAAEAERAARASSPGEPGSKRPVPATPSVPLKSFPRTTDDRGMIIKRDRPKDDEPIHLPNGGNDQGSLHLDSEIGKLWAELYADDREPNSFINQVAKVGEDLGRQRADMETETLPRLRELKASASDEVVADRIQKVIDRLSAPPAGDLNLPEGIPAPLREYLENLAKIPTARMRKLPGTAGGAERGQSVLDRKLEIVRRLARGQRQSRDLDILTQRDLHEGTDGAVSMWVLGEKLQDGQTALEIRRWLRSLDKRE